MEYFRIDLPEKKYIDFDSSSFPYTFQYPVYGTILPYQPTFSSNNNTHGWINIHFPDFKATLFITYVPVQNNLPKLLEDCRSLAYKHNIKADAIREILYLDSTHKVYGIIYEIKGNAASPSQFYLTDSTRHFLRGSLYFNVKPNKDSLAPVIQFLQEDIQHLIESLQWK